MLDINEIKKAIKELELSNTTFSSCSKLATLYTILDHVEGEHERDNYELAYSPTDAPQVIAQYGDSEFMAAISGKDMSEVIKIIDDHLDSIRAVNQRVYDGVIRRIKSI